ncbi:GntR family transcriptional regulator [Sinisalibacter aestuarii]|uniref:GntR family transcriptional regulator n=1 Tax=Sinisalibacter aestuarii TaxID=2949426 RepID=A0ABQ5LY80_9RHOB|nr:FCD domain-containing protein [Sinisalibacter aestuarii]GKY89933.1 GntR family transcriptional regulator [Sinisalibacter aestuarii]
MDETATSAPAQGRGDDATEPTFATQSEAAYHRIREAIITGQLAPNEKLLLDGLRERFRFGTSPLREALSRLAADRLVIARGQRGFRVAPISEEEYRDIVNMRLLLEPEALQRSIANATLAWEGNVAAAFHRLSRVESALDRAPDDSGGIWEHENQRFHFALVENCGSPWLLNFITALADQAERYRRPAVEMRAVPMERLIQEHKALFDAAMSRNATLAAELLKVHIRNAASHLSKALFHAGDDAAGGQAIEAGNEQA